jgi:hypothetical protein
VRFQHVVLGGPPKHMDALGDFYERLGFAIEPDRLLFRAGETTIEFDPAPGAPFYHFAFLVPGDRFDAALAWAGEHADLLPDLDTGEVVFDFEDWDAWGCYFEDPAGNIVELAAHRGIDENGRDGDFSASEIVGLSELGLVGDKPALAAELEKLGFALWNGTLTDPKRLAFVGERGRTLILAPPGRGWVPTGRPAEIHPVEAVFAEGSAMLENGALVINATSA